MIERQLFLSRKKVHQTSKRISIIFFSHIKRKKEDYFLFSYCKSEVRLARSARGLVVDEGFAPYPYPPSGSGGAHQRMS